LARDNDVKTGCEGADWLLTLELVVVVTEIGKESSTSGLTFILALETSSSAAACEAFSWPFCTHHIHNDTFAQIQTPPASQLDLLHTHTHPFNSPMSGTTQVSRYQKGKTNLDFNEARDSEWQWHQLGHMQVCTPLQCANSPPLSFLQAGCPSCRPTNSVKALKA